MLLKGSGPENSRGEMMHAEVAQQRGQEGGAGLVLRHTGGDSHLCPLLPEHPAPRFYTALYGRLPEPKRFLHGDRLGKGCSFISGR